MCDTATIAVHMQNAVICVRLLNGYLLEGLRLHTNCRVQYPNQALKEITFPIHLRFEDNGSYG